MGIAKKGKRKFIFNSENFYWWVEDDFYPDTGHSILITVVSEDKKFLVKYYVDQRQDSPFISVVGTRFPGWNETGECHKRFLCPKFTDSSSVTPKNIYAIMEWCFDSSVELIEMD